MIEYVGWGWMVMGIGVGWKVMGGMMISGILVFVDVVGVGEVMGKVVWFGGRVYIKDVGVMFWIGLIL